MKHVLYLLLFTSTMYSCSENQNQIKQGSAFKSVYVDNKTPFCIKAYIRGSIQSMARHHYDIVGNMETIPAYRARAVQIQTENPLCAAIVVVYKHDKESDFSYVSGIDKMEHANIDVKYGNRFYLSILQ